MKKQILLAITYFSISLTALHAQTNEGSILIGMSSTLASTGAGLGSDLMSMGFSTTTAKSDASGFKEEDPDKKTNINLQPRVGYFFADNLVLGLDIASAFSIEITGRDDDQYTSSIITAGPFFRYYIASDKVIPFIELGTAYGAATYSYESGDDSYNDNATSSIFSLNGGVGFAAFIGEKVSADMLVGYNSLTVKPTKNNDDDNRIVYGNFGFKIGFTVFL